MARLLWVGIGAAGGIYTYRRGQQAWDRAKERGVGGTAAVLAATTTSALHSLRSTSAEHAARRSRPVRSETGDGHGSAAQQRSGRRRLRYESPSRRSSARTAADGGAVLLTALRTVRSSARVNTGTLG